MIIIGLIIFFFFFFELQVSKASWIAFPADHDLKT